MGMQGSSFGFCLYRTIYIFLLISISTLPLSPFIHSMPPKECGDTTGRFSGNTGKPGSKKVGKKAAKKRATSKPAVKMKGKADTGRQRVRRTTGAGRSSTGKGAKRLRSGKYGTAKETGERRKKATTDRRKSARDKEARDSEAPTPQTPHRAYPPDRSAVDHADVWVEMFPWMMVLGSMGALLVGVMR